MLKLHLYTEKLFIGTYVLFYNNNSKKILGIKGESRGAMVIIPSGLKIFRSQNTKDLKIV